MHCGPPNQNFGWAIAYPVHPAELPHVWQLSCLMLACAACAKTATFGRHSCAYDHSSVRCTPTSATELLALWDCDSGTFCGLTSDIGLVMLLTSPIGYSGPHAVLLAYFIAYFISGNRYYSVPRYCLFLFYCGSGKHFWYSASI